MFIVGGMDTITDHKWRQTQTGGLTSTEVAKKSLCSFMNCGRPVEDHATRTYGAGGRPRDWLKFKPCEVCEAETGEPCHNKKGEEMALAHRRRAIILGYRQAAKNG